MSLAEVKRLASNGSYRPFKSEIALALIFCNSYTGTHLDLADCALNDGILAYNSYKLYGYTPYLYHDISKREFKLIIETFLSAETDKLSIYFIGHGSQTSDCSGDEADRRDEVFVLKDGHVVDDEIYSLIQKYNKSKQLTLISDCCHSGSIFDIPASSPILTISACTDSQSAAQYWFERKGNGCFSYYFWKYMKESRDSKVILPKINEKLKPFSQCCTLNHGCSCIL